MQVACDIPLKSSRQGLQLHFEPHLNQRLAYKVMGTQSCKNPETKCHLDVGLVEKHIVYYKGEGGGFPQVQAMVNFVNSSSLVACSNTKSVPNAVSNLLVGFVQVCVSE